MAGCDGHPAYPRNSVDTLFYDFVHFLYLLSLGVLVGGSFALGGAVAPTLFRSLDRSRAGTLFGGILARWDAAAIIASLALVGSSILLFVNFETGEARIYLRYLAVGLVVIATLYSSAWANPIARALRANTPHFDELPPDADTRRQFAGYHRRSTRAMSVAILGGLVALYLS
jgi:hypothetical protein